MDHTEIFLLIVFLEIVEMCTFFSQEVKIIRFSDLTNLRIHENDFLLNIIDQKKITLGSRE